MTIFTPPQVEVTRAIPVHLIEPRDLYFNREGEIYQGNRSLGRFHHGYGQGRQSLGFDIQLNVQQQTPYVVDKKMDLHCHFHRELKPLICKALRALEPVSVVETPAPIAKEETTPERKMASLEMAVTEQAALIKRMLKDMVDLNDNLRSIRRQGGFVPYEG